MAIQQTRKSSEATNKNLKKSVLVTKDEVMEYKRAIAECDSIVVKNEDTLYKIVNHMFSLAFDMVSKISATFKVLLLINCRYKIHIFLRCKINTLSVITQ